jgi:methionyl-tRNA formyltransferase
VKNYGIIFSDTSRSRAYIQLLIKSVNSPSYFLVMDSSNSNGRPKKNKGIPSSVSDYKFENENWSFDPNEDIETTLNKNSLQYDKISVSDINESKVIDTLKSIDLEYFVYSGSGGIILKKHLFKLGKKFIHSHGGYLPNYQGSTCNYYSILNNDDIAASVIIMNEKIDDGPILLRKKFKVNFEKNLIDYYYDPLIRAITMTQALNNLDFPHENLIQNLASKESMYYVIHPVLKHLAILK